METRGGFFYSLKFLVLFRSQIYRKPSSTVQRTFFLQQIESKFLTRCHISPKTLYTSCEQELHLHNHDTCTKNQEIDLTLTSNPQNHSSFTNCPNDVLYDKSI